MNTKGKKSLSLMMAMLFGVGQSSFAATTDNSSFVLSNAFGDVQQQGSTVKTGKDSRAQAQSNNMVARMAPNSTATVDPTNGVLNLLGGEALLQSTGKNPVSAVTNLASATSNGGTMMVQSNGALSRFTVLSGVANIFNRSDRSVTALKPGLVYEITSIGGASNPLSSIIPGQSSSAASSSKGGIPAKQNRELNASGNPKGKGKPQNNNSASSITSSNNLLGPIGLVSTTQNNVSNGKNGKNSKATGTVTDIVSVNTNNELKVVKDITGISQVSVIELGQGNAQMGKNGKNGGMSNNFVHVGAIDVDKSSGGLLSSAGIGSLDALSITDSSSTSGKSKNRTTTKSTDIALLSGDGPTGGLPLLSPEQAAGKNKKDKNAPAPSPLTISIGRGILGPGIGTDSLGIVPGGSLLGGLLGGAGVGGSLGGLLGGSTGGLPVVGGLLGGTGGLPIVGGLLGGSTGGLPIVGGLLGGSNGGLPVVGGLLGGLPIIGTLLVGITGTPGTPGTPGSTTTTPAFFTMTRGRHQTYNNMFLGTVPAGTTTRRGQTYTTYGPTGQPMAVTSRDRGKGQGGNKSYSTYVNGTKFATTTRNKGKGNNKTYTTSVNGVPVATTTRGKRNTYTTNLGSTTTTTPGTPGTAGTPGVIGAIPIVGSVVGSLPIVGSVGALDKTGLLTDLVAGQLLGGALGGAGGGLLSLTNITSLLQNPLTIFETTKTITKVYQVDPSAILGHDLVAGFPVPLGNITQIQTTLLGIIPLASVTGVTSGSPTSLLSDGKLLKQIQIVRVPTQLSYLVGPQVGNLISLAPSALGIWTPNGTIGGAGSLTGLTAVVGQTVGQTGAISQVTGALLSPTGNLVNPQALNSTLNVSSVTNAVLNTGLLNAGVTNSLGLSGTVRGVTGTVGGVLNSVAPVGGGLGGVVPSLGGALGGLLK